MRCVLDCCPACWTRYAFALLSASSKLLPLLLLLLLLPCRCCCTPCAVPSLSGHPGRGCSSWQHPPACQQGHQQAPLAHCPCLDPT
jgi:hypothetical protein